MNYVGLDVHRDWTTIVALDPETGELVRFDRVANDRESFGQVLEALERPLQGIVETGPNVWAMYDEVSVHFDRLIVCDALEVKEKMPSRAPKTDRRDARNLALMLAEGRAPEPLWIPDLGTRDLRALTRGRIKLTQQMTQVINFIRSLCASFGQRCPYSSLHGAKARRWLEDRSLPPQAQGILEAFVSLLAHLESLVAQADEAVEAQVRERPDAQRLMTIPGVGAFIALSILAEIGDLRRFRDPKRLVSYAGLAPQVSQSGEHTHTGPLPHTGDPWLRYVAVLAAQAASRRKAVTAFGRCYWRVRLRHGPNPAKVATARKVLTIAYHLLKRQEDYREPARPVS
jgi:transposase